jgi:DNA-binding LacI/PurR family transcriptional regulator
MDAVEKQGLNIKPEICNVPRLKSNEFYANAIYKYLQKSDISAIYLLNGSFALPLFVAMQRLGLKTPDDLEIMCFDDIGYISSVYEYDFSYVKMPLFEMGCDVTEYLLGKLKEDKKARVVKKIYNAELASHTK